MIPDDFLGLLRCPATGQPLAWADEACLTEVNARFATGRQAEAAGHQQTHPEPLTAALVRADRKVLYPVQDGIPVLLKEAAVAL